MTRARRTRESLSSLLPSRIALGAGRLSRVAVGGLALALLACGTDDPGKGDNGDGNGGEDGTGGGTGGGGGSPSRRDGGTGNNTGSGGGGGGGGGSGGGTGGNRDGGAGAGGDAGTGGTGGTGGVDGGPMGRHPTDWIFDNKKFDTYTFTLSAAAWKLIEDPPAKDPTKPASVGNPLVDKQEVKAKLKVGAEDVGEVRFRLKGQASLANCRELPFLKAAPTDKLCRRPSFKVAFDAYDPEKRFHGLKNLNFNSGIFDGSHLRPWVAMRAFKQMGILTPRVWYAYLEVFIEGQTTPVRQGVYPIVEEIDGRFTDYNFPKGEGDGTVYKDRWFGPGANLAYYQVPEFIETNKTMAMHKKVLAFSDELAKATPAALPGVVDKWMSLDYLYRYLAADRFIRHWDGPVTIFSGQPVGGHNFFVYEDPTKDRIWLVPWDTDQTLITWNGWDDAPDWTQAATDCSKNVGPNNIPSQCSPIWKAAAANLDGYKAAITKLLAGPLDLAKLNAEIDDLIKVIEPGVKKEKGAANFDRWVRGDVESLRKMIEVSRDRIERIRDNKPMAKTQFGLKLDTPFAFDDVTRFDFYNGSGAIRNGKTKATQDLNGSGAIRGTQEARATFEMRNEDTGGNNQQAGFSIRVPMDQQNWSALKTVKFKIKSDSPRQVRVNLSGGGQKFGWNVMATTAATDQTLQAAMLAQLPGAMAADVNVLKMKVENLEIVASPKERGADGRIPGDAADAGWIAIDDLEIVTK